MENIHFLLKKDTNDQIINKIALDELQHFTNAFMQKDIDNSSNNNNNISISSVAEVYKTVYNVKQIAHILAYYKIQRRSMTKDEMIQMILFFEMEPANKTVVQRRIRLWENIRELKDDPYFSRYILF